MKNMAQVMETGGNAYNVKYDAPVIRSRHFRLWDGSDFFMVWPLPRFIFVTEKAKNVVERAGLSRQCALRRLW
jgi:hypothetical protein